MKPQHAATNQFTPGPIRARVDWSKANALLDSYRAKLTDPALLPMQYGQGWTRVEWLLRELIDWHKATAQAGWE